MRVLFIDIDTLRPDHMGCYGYHRDTTPNMDRVCAEGIRFDQYYCSDAPCLPSRASLVSGMFGIRNGAVGHGGTAADRRLTGPRRDFTDIMDEGNFHNIFAEKTAPTGSGRNITAPEKPAAERKDCETHPFADKTRVGDVQSELPLLLLPGHHQKAGAKLLWPYDGGNPGSGDPKGAQLCRAGLHHCLSGGRAHPGRAGLL